MTTYQVAKAKEKIRIQAILNIPRDSCEMYPRLEEIVPKKELHLYK
jgi:hypothetical protein